MIFLIEIRILERPGDRMIRHAKEHEFGIDTGRIRLPRSGRHDRSLAGFGIGVAEHRLFIDPQRQPLHDGEDARNYLGADPSVRFFLQLPPLAFIELLLQRSVDGFLILITRNGFRLRTLQAHEIGQRDGAAFRVILGEFAAFFQRGIIKHHRAMGILPVHLGRWRQLGACRSGESKQGEKAQEAHQVWGVGSEETGFCQAERNRKAAAIQMQLSATLKAGHEWISPFTVM